MWDYSIIIADDIDGVKELESDVCVGLLSFSQIFGVLCFTCQVVALNIFSNLASILPENSCLVVVHPTIFLCWHAVCNFLQLKSWRSQWHGIHRTHSHSRQKDTHQLWWPCDLSPSTARPSRRAFWFSPDLWKHAACVFMLSAESFHFGHPVTFGIAITMVTLV